MRPVHLILFLAVACSACAPLPSTVMFSSTPASSPFPSKTSPVLTPIISTGNAVRVVTINDIAVVEPEVSLQNGNIIATICYTWNGEGIWELGSSAIKYVNGYSTFYTSEEISLENLMGPEPGFIRCVKQTYSQIQKTADLSQLSLEIQSIHLLPLPTFGEECKTYQERLSNSLDVKNLEIEAGCAQEGTEVKFSILKKPNNMNTKQILLLLDKVAGRAEGPWLFQVKLR